MNNIEFNEIYECIDMYEMNNPLNDSELLDFLRNTIKNNTKYEYIINVISSYFKNENRK